MRNRFGKRAPFLLVGLAASAPAFATPPATPARCAGASDAQPGQPPGKPDAFVTAQPRMDTIHALVAFFSLGFPGRHTVEKFRYPDPCIDVYDIVDAGRAQHDLTEWAARQADIVQNPLIDPLWLFATFITDPAPRVPASVNLTIEFSDGSKIDVTSATTTRLEFSVVPDSGIDSHSNHVLSSARALPVMFGFSRPGNPNDFADWQKRMKRLDYDVVAGTWKDWACAKSNEYYCIRQH